MANLIVSAASLLKKTWLNKRVAAELFMGLLLACSVGYGIIVHNINKTLSEDLEIANNNTEVYLELANNSLQAFGVLKMDMEKLSESKDSLILELDNVRKENKIKSSSLTSAATQTQTIFVNKSKGVRGDIIEILKDTVYKDSIKYNDLTNVYYCIGKDTVNIALDIKNTQYLYTYKTREYKNKKSLIKRIFTFDFKKVDRYKYKLVNTNDLLKESDVRIIEQK